MNTKILLILAFFLIGGCATNRESILALSAGAGVVGGMVETARAPDGDNKVMHAILGAAVFSAAGALAGLFIFDEQKAHEKTKAELSFKSAQLEELQRSQNFSLRESNASLVKDLSLKELLQKPGAKVFQLDHWNWLNEHEAVHEDQYVLLKELK